MFPHRPAGLFAAVALAAAAAAQEPTAAPPREGVPATFRAFLVADDRFPPKVNPPVKAEDRDPRDRTRKMHDLVGEYALSPVVAVFVRAPGDAELPKTDGVLKLAQAVDKLIPLPKYRAEKLAGFVQFLRVEGMPKTVTLTNPDGTTTPVELDAEFPDDEKRDAYADEVLKLAKAAAAPNVPFGLAPTAGKAVAAWGLKADAPVTVVVYNRMRVWKRWTFPAGGPSDEQVAEVMKETEAMIADLGN